MEVEEINIDAPQNNDDNSETVVHVTPKLARKRKRFPAEWKKNKAKKARHEPKGFPVLPNCHHGKNSMFKCNELSLQDARKIHQRYYKDANLESKKHFILRHVTVTSAKKKGSRPCDTGNSRDRVVSVSYVLPKQREGQVQQVRVCRSAFLSILQEGRDRLQRLCKKYLETGVVPAETRGGARQVDKYNKKREAVINFIKTFQPIQNHYCRGKIKIRQYLPSELSIKKMWEMYVNKEKDEDLSVEYEFFRHLFNENFNISFHAPYSDKCSTCSRLENKIELEKNKEKRDELNVELSVHKKRADTFFSALKEKKENELILSYDCQKNLVIPKVPDQEAYYRRQLYLYNFTVVEGDSKSNLNKDNCFAYAWCEHEFAKGSVQISSALYHRLCSSNLDGVTTVRLFSDGCGGQNKNSTIVFMLSYWLLNQAPNHVKEVVLTFPIVGHSFIPPDRVFGILERQFKSKSVIENPDKYLDIFQKYTTVIRFGEDCEVIDWKQLSDEVLKRTTDWHFKFQKAKKIVFRRNKALTTTLVRGEPFYNFESGKSRSLCKRGKSCGNADLERVKKGVTVKSANLDDVKRLLELHFGENWEDNELLKFYTEVFKGQNQAAGQEALCEGQEEIDFELNEDTEDNFAF